MSIFYNKHFNAELREASLEKGLKIALQENILFCMKAITSNFFLHTMLMSNKLLWKYGKTGKRK
jgi:hypothetical protein